MVPLIHIVGYSTINVVYDPNTLMLLVSDNNTLDMFIHCFLLIGKLCYLLHMYDYTAKTAEYKRVLPAPKNFRDIVAGVHVVFVNKCKDLLLYSLHKPISSFTVFMVAINFIMHCKILQYCVNTIVNHRMSIISKF